MNSTQIWGLAQLGERLPCKQEVTGSIPVLSTKQLKITNYKLQMRNSTRDWLKSHENEISLSLLRLDNL